MYVRGNKRKKTCRKSAKKKGFRKPEKNSILKICKFFRISQSRLIKQI